MNPIRDQLVVNGVSVHYGKLCAVRNASLNVPPGKVVTVLGPNSAGKTSLLSAIAMQHRVRSVSGSIVFDSGNLLSLSTVERRRMGVRYVPEFRGIFPSLSVLDNFRLAADTVDSDWEDELLSVKKLFPEVFRDRQAAIAGNLSGGEQQMLALGRALIGEPRLLLLDEPRLGLGAGVVKRLREAVLHSASGGVGVLISDQIFTPWMDVSSIVYKMVRGSLSGPVTDRDALDQIAQQLIVE